ncbi:MAG: cytochrome P450 [Actinomycetota bacterium]|nr:cytochrome P450 [Actinomycetota bacterium]
MPELTQPERSETWDGKPIVVVSDYEELMEVLRSKEVSADSGGPHDHLFRKNTLMRLDGATHLQRRRAMNGLLKRDGHEWFRREVLLPTIDQALVDAGVGRSTSAVEVDLVPFAGTCFIQMAGAMAGLDAAASPSGAAELDRIRTLMHAAFGGTYEELTRGFDPTSDAAKAGLDAKVEFERVFVEPSLARRRELVAEVAAGDRDEATLPRDLLTFVAQGTDPAWDDYDLVVREAMQVVSAATNTSTHALIHTLNELFGWFSKHPDDWELRTDREFLLGAVNDGLRLHNASPAMVRVALEDLELCHGTRVSAGEYIALPGEQANQDPAFGTSPDQFNPRRTVERPHQPMGVTFGGGAHMCLGMPLVMGANGIDGSLVHTLRRFFAAGMIQHPVRQGVLHPATHHKWESYPVLFDSSVAINPSGRKS